MQIEKPYFLENKEWYYFDEEKEKYELTDKATDKAKQSFEEYIKIKEEN